jgi:hypothetical protein
MQPGMDTRYPIATTHDHRDELMLGPGKFLRVLDVVPVEEEDSPLVPCCESSRLREVSA